MVGFESGARGRDRSLAARELRPVSDGRCLFFLEGEYNGDMTTLKTYPVGEFTPEEKKEIDYIRAYDSEMSHEELMYLHYAKKEYAL